jgi:hypothetical protein
MTPTVRRTMGLVLAILPGFLPANQACAATGRASPSVIRQPLKVVVDRQKVTAILAPALQRALTRYFPGYRLPIREFTHQMVAKAALGEKAAEGGPFACIGDFDGNGLADVALYLIEAGPPHRLRHHRIPRRRWLLVAFRQTGRGTFRPYVLARRYDPEFWRNEYSEALNRIQNDDLVRKPRGSRFVSAWSRARGYIKTRLQHDAISEGWNDGEAETLYYFHNGGYDSIDTVEDETDPS